MNLNPMVVYKQIRDLLRIRKEVSTMSISELKTSEGRMTLVFNILSIYAAVQGFLPAALVLKISAASIAAYAISRSITKAAEAIARITPTPKDDAIVAEAIKVLDAVAPKIEVK